MLLANPIDCADCMTFLQETNRGNFIFVVGVWEYATSKRFKMFTSVWFYKYGTKILIYYGDQIMNTKKIL